MKKFLMFLFAAAVFAMALTACAPKGAASSEAPGSSRVPAPSEASALSEAPGSSKVPAPSEASAPSEAPASSEAPGSSEVPAPSKALGGTALPSAPVGGFTADYRLEKLNEVNDLVLGREAVPADYLRYLPDNVKVLVEEYNEQTGRMRVNYTGKAMQIVSALLYENISDPGNYDQSALYYEWIGRISHYALYENVDDLCRSDPYLAYPLMVEAGGSYGMWPQLIHDRESKEEKGYFALVERLLDAMDAAREITEKD